MSPLDKMNRTPNHPSIRGQHLRAQHAAPALSPSARRWFGRALLLERAYTGHTQTDIAEALGMHGPHGIAFVQRVEDGVDELSPARAQVLKARLGIPAPELLEQVTPYTADRQDRPAPRHRRGALDAHAKAIVLASVILAAVLTVVTLVSLAAGHQALGWAAAAAVWIVLSPAAALLIAPALAARR